MSAPQSDHKCELCVEPMPKGEEMFKYHGYSGECPTVKPDFASTGKWTVQAWNDLRAKRHNSWDVYDGEKLIVADLSRNEADAIADAHNASLAAEREKHKSEMEQCLNLHVEDTRNDAETMRQLRSQLAAAQAAIVKQGEFLERVADHMISGSNIADTPLPTEDEWREVFRIGEADNTNCLDAYVREQMQPLVDALKLHMEWIGPPPTDKHSFDSLREMAWEKGKSALAGTQKLGRDNRRDGN